MSVLMSPAIKALFSLVCSWFKSCNYFPSRRFERCEGRTVLSERRRTMAAGGLGTGGRWEGTLDWTGLDRIDKTISKVSSSSHHQYCTGPTSSRPTVLEGDSKLDCQQSCLRSVCLIDPRIRQGRVRWRVRDAATSDTNYPILGGEEGEGLMFLWLQHPLTSHLQSVYRFNETWEPESHIWGGLNDFNQQNHFSEILGNNCVKIQHF